MINAFHSIHLEDLKRSGLSDSTIEQAGFRTVPPNDINKKIGFNIPSLTSCYEIPYDTTFSRFRAFYDENNNGKYPKYIQRKNSGNRLYIPSTVIPILKDSSIPLYITEGEKKALKAAQEGIFFIGLSGLWNWTNKGSKELIPDFDRITLKNRTVYIVPDNDWLHPNKHGYRKNLKQAVYLLADKLKQREATVYIVELPQGDMKGLDDFLCNHTIADFKALPAIEFKSLSKRIEEATKENYKDFLPEIANLDDEIQKELLCKALSKKIDVNYRTIRNALKEFEADKEPAIADSNIIIAHPSYEIKSDFAVLGFRETIVSGNEPQDRNFFIISSDEGYMLHDNRVLRLYEKFILFDERERLLLRAEDRWKKESILSFINNPISPEGLYPEIKQVLKQYIEFQKEPIYGLVTAWIIATYFFLIFHAFPFLFIYGKKQSGKSRFLDLLERLAFNAMKIKGVSVASMTDSIDGVRGTFLNDQAESLSDSRNAEILGILADSYTVGGGKRRIVDISNKHRRIVEFSTYAPKAFASIREIDSDLKDRCIQIIMLRAIKDYPYPEAFLPVWHVLRDKLYRLSLTRWREVKQIYETTGQGVLHRVKELWRPLETILKLENVSAEEMKAIKDFFLESMLETQTELSDSEIELFEILLEKLKETQEGTFSVEDITESMKTRPREDISEKGLQTWAGRILRQFSLYGSQGGRKNNKRTYHFTYEHVKDVFNRYLSTGSRGGKVAEMAKINVLEDATYQNTGGKEVAQLPLDANNNATYEPPIETQVATPNIFKNKDICHLSTSTTYPVTDGKKVFKGASFEMDNEI